MSQETGPRTYVHSDSSPCKLRAYFNSPSEWPINIMRLIHTITSLCLSSIAAAAVHQRCVGFESPSNKNTFYQINNVGDVDTSVLLYHIADIDHTNIPLFVDDEVLRQEPNGFAVCTSKRMSTGLCGDKETGQFIYTEDSLLQDQILNAYVHPKETVHYRIDQEGIYCAVVYQEGVPSVDGVQFVENHWYGKVSLAEFEKVKILFINSLLVSLSIIVISFMFRGARKAYIGTLLDDVRVMFTFKSLIISVKLLLFAIWADTADVQFSFIQPYTLVDQLYSVVSMALFYKLSIGVFGFTREKISTLNIEKKFKVMLRLYAISSLILVFSPFLLNFAIFAPLLVIAGLICAFVWIPMIVTMWRNAKATEREMVDPVFAKNYSRSRKATIWIPVIFGTVSFVGQIIVQVNTISGSFSPDVIPSFESSFAHSLEVSISQSTWFVLLKHLPEFSMLCVEWAIIFIWRPQMTERTEDIHSNELSDGNHGALKLEGDDAAGDSSIKV